MSGLVEPGERRVETVDRRRPTFLPNECAGVYRHHDGSEAKTYILGIRALRPIRLCSGCYGDVKKTVPIREDLRR